MRIISGERRGHKFDGPEDASTRPTSDMVRESIYNILGERPEGREVYDLFAGAGGLGLEALSRGATHAVFVERDRRNAALIKRNVGTLRFEGRAGVIVADAYRWARTFSLTDGEPVLVLIDPPYRDFEEQPARVLELVRSLVDRLPAGSTIVVESDRDHRDDVLPDPELWDIRRYGGTQVAIRDLPDPSRPDDEADAEDSPP